MTSKRCESDSKSIFEKAYEIILCFYIVIAPIINSLNKINVFGLTVHIIVVVVLLATKVVLEFTIDSSKKHKIGFPLLVLTVFTIEIFIHSLFGNSLDVGLLLLIFLYSAFLSTPKSISQKNIYVSFYISAMIAAIYSFVKGFNSGSVVRTATLVDGSIALIAMLIAFFGGERFEKTTSYEILKYFAIFSCFIVAAFGMSRSRVLIIFFIIFLKFCSLIKNAIKKGKIKISSILFFPFFLVLLIVILNSNLTQNLFDAIGGRFENGLESTGREEEIGVAWKWFLENPIHGKGWGKLSFRDSVGYRWNYYNHCMYVAFLARGGILMGIAFFVSFSSIAANVFKNKNIFSILSFFVLLLLGYGNAGIFNYTISSLIIPMTINCENNK